MKKKLLTLLLASMMIVSVVGCGTNETSEPSADTTVSVNESEKDNSKFTPKNVKLVGGVAEVLE